MWQPCTFNNNSWSLWSALPRRTWSSITRPDPIPEVELEKCETREIIIVLFFPVVANSRHFTLFFWLIQVAFMCFVGARINTTSLSWARDFLVELCVWFTNWSIAAIRNDSNRFLMFLKDLDWEVDWLVPTELFGVSWILRTASFNFDQLSGFGQVGLCTWSFNQPRNPSQSWTTMWGFIQFQWAPLVFFLRERSCHCA